MPGLRFLAAATLAAGGLLAAAPAHADCKDVREFIKSETAGPDKFVDTFNFRKNHRGDTVLMLVKDTIEKGHLPKRWLLLSRAAQTGATEFCVVSRGVEFGQHEDKAERQFSDRFGEAGSLYPQCASDTPDVPAETLLRAWANRELPQAINLYVASPDGPGFQFVIGPDHDWIIIENNNGDPKTSCVYDRGTDVMMRFNNTTNPP